MQRCHGCDEDIAHGENVYCEADVDELMSALSTANLALRALLARYLADAGEPEPGSEADRVLSAAKAALGE